MKLFIILVALGAIGGAVVWGFVESHEVRGASEMAVQETVARVDGVPETLAPAHEEMEDWRAYMLGLEAEDYATYTISHTPGSCSSLILSGRRLDYIARVQLECGEHSGTFRLTLCEKRLE